MCSSQWQMLNWIITASDWLLDLVGSDVWGRWRMVREHLGSYVDSSVMDIRTRAHTQAATQHCPHVLTYRLPHNTTLETLGFL